LKSPSSSHGRTTPGSRDRSELTTRRTAMEESTERETSSTLSLTLRESAELAFGRSKIFLPRNHGTTP